MSEAREVSPLCLGVQYGEAQDDGEATDGNLKLKGRVNIVYESVYMSIYINKNLFIVYSPLH